MIYVAFITLLFVFSFIVLDGLTENRIKSTPVKQAILNKILDKILLFKIVFCLVLVLPFYFYVFQGKINIFDFAKFGILLISLFFVSYSDYKKMIIPNNDLLFMAVSGIVMMIVEYLYYRSFDVFKSYILGFLAAFLLMLFIYFITKRSIGEGDVKLFSILGFFLGFNHLLLCLLFISVSSFLTGMGVMIYKKLSLKQLIPMAPSVLVGTYFYLVIIFLRGGLL